jgi:hypothetical protein
MSKRSTVFLQNILPVCVFCDMMLRPGNHCEIRQKRCNEGKHMERFRNANWRASG